MMVKNSASRPSGAEVARLYLMIAASTAGYAPAAIQAALSMSITLLGEQQGLMGEDLLAWIDAITATARLAARTASQHPPTN